jgi:hypothetical protein
MIIIVIWQRWTYHCELTSAVLVVICDKNWIFIAIFLSISLRTQMTLYYEEFTEFFSYTVFMLMPLYSQQHIRLKTLYRFYYKRISANIELQVIFFDAPIR